MKKVFCYPHIGSGNHGCEAIVRSTIKIIRTNFVVYSSNEKEDYKYNLNNKVEIRGIKEIKYHSLRYYVYNLIHKLIGINMFFPKYQYKNMFKEAYGIALSIGGDNYCYDDYYKQLSYINNKLNKKDIKTILWGCSIEPQIINNEDVIDDLQHYSMIVARESITYEALVNAKINLYTRLFPDPAFVLPIVNLNLPDRFDYENTIGINISPLIINYEDNEGIVLNNYVILIKHIIESTLFQIALIPHVVINNNDDRLPLKKLFEKFKDTGRVVFIEDYNCMELKGFISRCRMFIGARTHATIAAYSTCVPTLSVGYSVKSKGIAKDIFGTYENYVIPVQSLKKEDDLTKAFEWLKENEDSIRTHLQNFMPSYIEKAWQAGEEVKKLMES